VIGTSAFRARAAALAVPVAVCIAVQCPMSSARADVTDDCNAAAEKAQTLRRDERLGASREKLLACVRAQCPAVVRIDCTKWLADLDAVMPSVVIRAVDVAGADVADVRMSVDGRVVATTLDGKEMPFDPGTHVFRFEHDGSLPVEKNVILREGEQHRMLSVTLDHSAGIAGTRGRGSEGPSAEDASPQGHRSLLLPLTLVGVGVVGMGVASYLWLSGLADRSHLQSACFGHCTTSEVDGAYHSLVAGDVVAGVSIVSAGIGAWMLLSGHPASEQAASMGGGVVPGGAVLDLRGRF
jgi:hypothetical protein